MAAAVQLVHTVCQNVSNSTANFLAVNVRDVVTRLYFMRTTERSHGLWYFPPPPPRKVLPPLAERAAEGRMKRQEVRLEGYEASAALLQELVASGAPRNVLLEQQATASLDRRLRAQSNRCERCWHDRAQRCICAKVGGVRLSLPVKVLVLMHHKEYFRASDDAKLLLMMLPPEQVRLFIFGRPGELESLQAEIDEDPMHALLLWPGDRALTVEQYLETAVPTSSAWRTRGCDAPASVQTIDQHAPPHPVLRIVVLDAVYRTARMMFRHLMRLQQTPLQHVALHPSTLSVYSRAQHGYAKASATSVGQSGDPAALRICTVEAVALLLEELGEPTQHVHPLVEAVITNNEALGMDTAL